MLFKVKVLHTSSGASFATHGSVREDLRPSEFTTTVEAFDSKEAEKIAELKAKQSDEFYGRTLGIIWTT